jgi:hypothetical protein
MGAETRTFLESTLRGNFLFSSLEDLNPVIAAMESAALGPGDVLAWQVRILSGMRHVIFVPNDCHCFPKGKQQTAGCAHILLERRLLW